MTTSLSGFIEFVRSDMGITPDQVPDDSPSFLSPMAAPLNG
ncbi:Uncharacterised protein [Klebsiella pneumoniae]|uniref:Uncharacterized protein n=1 Tax=Klebsiella pneumoniae TaxID=573 RepID=A0A447RM98_KLEPN|nr:Uncharacterised protein [Klebsiella pneumoniae]